MDSLTLICTAGFVIAGGLYWFVCGFGSIEVKVEDKYKQYWSFFLCPKEIEKPDKVPAFVDTFYNIVTDIYEWCWGQSFHFSPSIPGKSHKDATRLHKGIVVDLINVNSGDKILDVGCGIGVPMRVIVSHSKANVVGITINKYQVRRAKIHNQKDGLDSLCEAVCDNFLKMPFRDNTFDGIERGDALPGLRSYDEISQIAKKIGFEIVKEKDLARPPSNPWWTRLEMGRFSYWRNHLVVTVLSALGIAPKEMFMFMRCCL
ncbi:hypothetical protein MKX01_022433 [Papaver californicum]|nr:hypothetical protein MKX01_022433 [Papaver californicum]